MVDIMWKSLERYPEYEINTNGDIRRKGTDEIRKVYMVNGHPKVILKGNTEYISRLVAETYIPNPEGKSDVRHVNKDKTDNSISNLEWSTHSQTQKDSYLTGRDAPGGNIKPKKVRIVETGKVYASINSCAKDIYGSPSGVRQCLNGKIKTYKGFHIEYVV